MRLGLRLCTTVLTAALAGAPLTSDAAPSLTAKAYRDEGARLLEAKKYREAITALERALQGAPDYTEAWVDLGNARLAIGEHNEAAKAFQTALSQQPELSIARYNLAYALRRAGQLEQAAEAYRVYLASNPDDADAHYGLGETLRALGDKPAAAEAYERYASTEKRPDRQAWIDKARQLAAELRGGAAQPAIAAAPAKAEAEAAARAEAAPAAGGHLSFSELKASAAGPRPASFDRGIRKLRAGDYEGARADLEQARATLPDDALVLAALAGAQLGSNDPETAAGTYRRALTGAGPEASAAIRFGLAEALRASKDDGGAKDAYQRVLDDASASAELKRLARERLDPLTR